MKCHSFFFFFCWTQSFKNLTDWFLLAAPGRHCRTPAVCSVACRGSSTAAPGFSLWRLPLLWSSHSTVRTLQWLGCTGFVALWLVGSSQTRDQTCVPCIGKWILNHCTSREVPGLNLSKELNLVSERKYSSAKQGQWWLGDLSRTTLKEFLGWLGRALMVK